MIPVRSAIGTRRAVSAASSGDGARTRACSGLGWRRAVVPVSIVIAVAVSASACGSPDTREPGGDRAAATAEPPGRGVPARRQDLSIRDRADWRAVLGWSDSCEEGFAATRATEDGGLEFHPVASGMAIVQVQCAAGAYQPTWTFVLLDERSVDPAVRILAFDVYRSPDGAVVRSEQATELIGEAAVAADGREMALLSFSRQTRDCGVWTRYDIADGRPAVAEVRARLPCPDPPGTPIAADSGRPPAGWTVIAPAAGP